MFGSVLPAAALLLGIGPAESGQADAVRTPAPGSAKASGPSSSAPAAKPRPPVQKSPAALPSPPPAALPSPAPSPPPEPRPLEKKNPSVPVAVPSVQVAPAPRVAAPAAPAKPVLPEPAPAAAVASRPAPVDTPTVPLNVAVEIRAVDSMHRAIVVNQPIEEWRFDNVRTRYQTLLKQYGDNLTVEEALRQRLAKVTRHERAASAALTIRTILAQSRRRDRVVAAIQNKVAASASGLEPSYSAVGFVQPSSSMLDGHKVYALIGPTGSTVAYLDVPPGLDIHAHFTHRVGVRGVVHYNEDLGARLITVRDIEALSATRR